MDMYVVYSLVRCEFSSAREDIRQVAKIALIRDVSQLPGCSMTQHLPECEV
jgi:hypothetical protein